MLTIRQEKTSDAGAREALLDASYPARSTKPSERFRAGREPVEGLSLVAIENGRLVGTVRLWTVKAGANGATLLLGPLAVDPARRNRGIGSALMQRALAEARHRGHGAVLLVGDVAYYGRFGFLAQPAAARWLPQLADGGRLLGIEFVAGALTATHGAIPRSRPNRTRTGAARPAARTTPRAA